MSVGLAWRVLPLQLLLIPRISHEVSLSPILLKLGRFRSSHKNSISDDLPGPSGAKSAPSKPKRAATPGKRRKEFEVPESPVVPKKVTVREDASLSEALERQAAAALPNARVEEAEKWLNHTNHNFLELLQT